MNKTLLQSRLPYLLITALIPLVISGRGLSQPSDQPTVNDELALDQSELADRFVRLEKLMLRMAEFDQATNPRRAETLKEAYSLAKEQQIRLQLEAVMRLLQQDQYRRAITNQETVVSDLRQLLKVLEAENRGDRLKDDQARVREYIKEVERLQRMQKSVRGRTESGIDEQQAAREQDQIAKRTGALGERIEENEGTPSSQESDATSEESASEAPASADSESEEGSDKPPAGGDSDGEGADADADESDSEPGEKTPSSDDANESESGEPSDSKSSPAQPAESAPSESGEGEAGEPASGQPSQSQSQSQPNQNESQPGGSPSGSSAPSQQPKTPPESFPGQQKIQQAQQQMEQAKQALDKAERDAAVERQKEAAKRLAEAKAQLEEILRQMREEEIERTLAQLESRFQKMLEMQLRVNERTIQLSGYSAEDRVLDIEASKLSFQEKRIVVEADKALTLLREEGSSVAFPETVDQMRDDMQQVVERLAQSKVGIITQGLEDDIVQSLEEMIEALQLAQEEQEERKANQQQGNPMGAANEMPLVNAIAELKMIKSLQLRINKRTNRYAQLLDNIEDPAGQADDNELIEALQGLSQRELRVQEITHNIAIGKNK